MHRRAARPSGVTVVELVIAIVILGLLAALAIPRFSRAAQETPAGELRHRLSVLRTAIELYQRDHGSYPATIERELASNMSELFVMQLTGRTTRDGQACDSALAECLGPYIRAVLPRSPFRSGAEPARVHVLDGSDNPRADEAIDADWVFNRRTGYIVVNSAITDKDGKRFDEY